MKATEKIKDFGNLVKVILHPRDIIKGESSEFDPKKLALSYAAITGCFLILVLTIIKLF